jgi:NAD-dependent SIR2 family protein deacetylase
MINEQLLHLQLAAGWIADADALLLTAGAGMGVDSGMPDFRGTEGFWKAYPAFAKLGMSFVQLANPQWFESDPSLAWGFYGHRYNLYKKTSPHEGFAILKRWADNTRHGAFIYTSNVDGHFQKAGFDPLRVQECHGTIHFLQCLSECGIGIYPAEPALPNGVDVDETTMRARNPLPSCPKCGAPARPNILMFNDGGWDLGIAELQEQRLREWLYGVCSSSRLVLIECGAGMAVPTVRHFSESVALKFPGKLIRINVREPQVPSGHLGLAMGALAALRAIDELLPRQGSK